AMTERGMTLDVAVTTSQACCPTCTQPSTHIHSDYRRTLADLPRATTPVPLHLRVRRFWCATPSCGRQTFTERVPQVAAHYARATTRMTVPPDLDWTGARGRSGGAALGPAGRLWQPGYAPAPGPESSHPSGSTAMCHWHRRLGQTERAHLWHHRGGSGPALSGRSARGPHR